MLPRLLAFAVSGCGSSNVAFSHLRNHFHHMRDGRIFAYFTEDNDVSALGKILNANEGAGRVSEMIDSVSLFQVRHLSYIIGNLKLMLDNHPEKLISVYLDLKHQMAVRVVDGLAQVYFEDEDVDGDFQQLLFDNPNVVVEVATLAMDAPSLVRFAGSVKRKGYAE